MCPRDACARLDFAVAAADITGRRETMSAPINPSSSFVNLTPGDPAPWFHQRSTSNPNYAFDTTAGRYIVLCFYASAADGSGLTQEERERLDAIKIELDRSYDLLHQRQARAAAGLDPDEATERSARTVEGYEQ